MIPISCHTEDSFFPKDKHTSSPIQHQSELLVLLGIGFVGKFGIHLEQFSSFIQSHGSHLFSFRPDFDL